MNGWRHRNGVRLNASRRLKPCEGRTDIEASIRSSKDQSCSPSIEGNRVRDPLEKQLIRIVACDPHDAQGTALEQDVRQIHDAGEAVPRDRVGRIVVEQQSEVRRPVDPG